MEKIHIIAHSMGNRVLTGALQAARAKGFQLKLNNVILAAPDIDAPTFVQDVLPQVLGIPERITMYANSEDRALQASSTVHGNVPRLGLSGAGLVVLPGMDTVDATQVDKSMLAHAYFGEQSRMLRGLHQILLYGRPPEARGLRKTGSGAWRF